MLSLLTAFSFVAGLITGSFLNVVILRGKRKKPFTGRSHCEYCGKKLKVSELIPVFSFLIQKGRCRSCGVALSWQYQIVELGTAFLFALAFWHLKSLNFLEFLNFDIFSFITITAVFIGISACIVILVADFRWHLIPNGAVLILFLLGTISSLHRSKIYALEILDLYKLIYDWSGAAILALFIAAIWFFSKGRGMGFGDVKLVFATSLLVGFPSSLVALIFAFWTGGATGLLLLVLKYKNLKSKIPFGPFILLGTVLAYFYADKFLILTGLSILF